MAQVLPGAGDGGVVAVDPGTAQGELGDVLQQLVALGLGLPAEKLRGKPSGPKRIGINTRQPSMASFQGIPRFPTPRVISGPSDPLL